MLALTLTALLSLAGVSHLLGRSPLHPAVVFTLLWSTQILGLLLFGDHFIAISPLTLKIIILGAFVFVISTFLVDIFQPQLGGETLRSATSANWPYLLCVAISAIALIGQTRIFMELGDSESLDVMLVAVRTLISIENEDVYGIFKYGNPVAFSAMLVLMIRTMRGSATRTQILLLPPLVSMSLIMAVLSTGRGPIVFVILSLITIYVLGSPRQNIQRRLIISIFSLLVFMFAIFWIMGNAMGKADADIEGALSNLGDYLFSSIPALSAHLDQEHFQLFGGTDGAQTLRLLIAITSKLGLTDPPPTLVQDFIEVPHLTNLYTIYLQFIQDFGILGFWLPIIFIGAAHGYLYRLHQASPADDFCLFVLALSYLPLVQSIFQETYFATLATWIQLGLIGLVLTSKRPVRRTRIQKKESIGCLAAQANL